MLTVKNRNVLERCITRLVKAEVEASWMGSLDATDQVGVVIELAKAGKALNEVLNRLTEGKSK